MTRAEAALVTDRLSVAGTLIEPRPIRRRYGRSLLGWLGVGIAALGAVACASLAFGAEGEGFVPIPNWPIAPTISSGMTIAPGYKIWAIPASQSSRGVCIFQNKRGGLVTFQSREDGTCNMEDARP